MKCPKCTEKLRVSHTYTATKSVKTHRAVCDECGTVVVIVSEIRFVNPSHGEGAAAEARRIEKKEFDNGN